MPSDVAIGDFDHDGRPDLAVAERGLNRVGLYRSGPTAGSFLSAPMATVATGTAPVSLVAVPLDRQTTANESDDLVVLSADQAHLQTFVNAHTPGQAAFAAGRFSYLSATGLFTRPRLHAAYIDTDPHIDVATIKDSFQNAGLSTVTPFATRTHVSIGTVTTTVGLPTDMALADISGQGRLDALLVQPLQGNVLVMFNPGQTPLYSTGRSISIPALGPSPTCVAAGDVDGDGRADVAIGNAASEVVLQLITYTLQGGFLFSTPLRVATGAAPRQVLLQDLTGDGRPELVVLTAAGQLRVYRHNGGAYPACFEAPQLLPTGLDPTSLRLADVDGDNRPDLLVACAGDHTVRVYGNTTQPLAAKSAHLAALTLYPNPATDRLRVQVPAGTEPLTATFTDALGRVLGTQTVPPSGELHAGQLPRGLCFVRLHNGLGSITRRVVLR
ncbi:T9SS type A sorting domain-containing protein [Hymenobacter koreensis]